MAPVKAVLRSKLDKEDTAKTLMEMVDKFDILSDASSVDCSEDCRVEDIECDQPDDDYELLARHEMLLYNLKLQQQQQQQQLQQQQLPTLPSLFPRPTSSLSPEAVPADENTQRMQQLFCLLSGQLRQQQQPQQQQQLRSSDEQPLNLSLREGASSTINSLKRPAAASVEAMPSHHSTVSGPSPRKRKRSYRLSDNEEIRAYQSSAPELFEWHGHKPMIHQFLLKLLNNPSCASLIRWLDRDNRLFKVLQPVSVARLWQFIKGNRTDNYECFARGIRHSRDIGKYFEAHEFRKKKVYKFAEKALLQAESSLPKHPAHGQPELPPTTTSTAGGDAESFHDTKKVSSCSSDAEDVAKKEAFFTSVRAKLKTALAERQQQQKQQQQQEQQQQRQRQLSVKEEELSFDDSPLIIADCEHL